MQQIEFGYGGIDHVQLAAPERCETEARRFFGDILGWQEIDKPDTLKHRGGVWFECGSHQVHIGVQCAFVPARKAHPAFAVRRLEKLKERLLLYDVAVIDDELRRDEGCRRFYVSDPFGNRLEFLERVQ